MMVVEGEKECVATLFGVEDRVHDEPQPLRLARVVVNLDFLHPSRSIAMIKRETKVDSVSTYPLQNTQDSSNRLGGTIFRAILSKARSRVEDGGPVEDISDYLFSSNFCQRALFKIVTHNSVKKSR